VCIQEKLCANGKTLSIDNKAPAKGNVIASILESAFFG